MLNAESRNGVSFVFHSAFSPEGSGSPLPCDIQNSALSSLVRRWAHDVVELAAHLDLHGAHRVVQAGIALTQAVVQLAGPQDHAGVMGDAADVLDERLVDSDIGVANGLGVEVVN